MSGPNSRLEWQHGGSGLPPPRSYNSPNPYSSPSPYNYDPRGYDRRDYGPPPRGDPRAVDYYYNRPPPNDPYYRNYYGGPPTMRPEEFYSPRRGAPPSPYEGRHLYLPDAQQPPYSAPGSATKREGTPAASRGGAAPPAAAASAPVVSTPPRSNAGGFATPIRTKKKSSEKNTSEDSEKSGKSGAKGRKGKNGKGDPLSLLAQVCNKADDEEEEEQEEQKLDLAMHSPAPVPTSPAHRHVRPSPVITPTSTPAGKQPLLPHPQISPVDHKAEGGYWATEPPEHYPPTRRNEASPYAQPPGPPTSRRYPPPPGSYPEWGTPEGGPPAIVERGSFESTGEHDPRSRGPLPPHSSSYYGGPAEYPPSRGPFPPPYMAQRKYPPPRWSSYPEGGPRPGPYPPYEMAHQPPPPPPPHYGAPYGEPHHAPFRNYPPAQHRPYPPGPMHMSPYTYVQQPHLGDEKTLLRKKFSWKHYPELERFLISNRDEYLRHSNMNYTAEQKQYNNWLTERLLEVAAENHYAFDPEDFNFVAIRDRIRCYYKSYVQTARKRGLNLPPKDEASTPLTPVKSAKKARTGEEKEDGEDDREKGADKKEKDATRESGDDDKEEQKESSEGMTTRASKKEKKDEEKEEK